MRLVGKALKCGALPCENSGEVHSRILCIYIHMIHITHTLITTCLCACVCMCACVYKYLSNIIQGHHQNLIKESHLAKQMHLSCIVILYEHSGRSTGANYWYLAKSSGPYFSSYGDKIITEVNES